MHRAGKLYCCHSSLRALVEKVDPPLILKATCEGKNGKTKWTQSSFVLEYVQHFSMRTRLHHNETALQPIVVLTSTISVMFIVSLLPVLLLIDFLYLMSSRHLKFGQDPHGKFEIRNRALFAL